MNFATLQGLTIPEGVVTQIADASGRVLWAVQGESGEPIVLEVEKVTSDTYAAETTYTGEEFILLDIYPKTNGTVSVTYGGLTKTITDTSGADEPNAQRVFFGTFNGVTDEVETPASGTLTIEGDYYAFGASTFTYEKASIIIFNGVKAIKSFGEPTQIPTQAFGSISTAYGGAIQTPVEINIPKTVESIGDIAFSKCARLSKITIPSSVKSIGENPFGGIETNILELDSKNEAYKIDSNCLIEKETNRLVSGFSDSFIPTYVKSIGKYAFYAVSSLSNVEIPSGVETIGGQAFAGTGLTSVTIPASVTSVKGCFARCDNLEAIIMLATTPPSLNSSGDLLLSNGATTSIIVPAGCGETYKTAIGWSNYADNIAEAS